MQLLLVNDQDEKNLFQTLEQLNENKPALILYKGSYYQYSWSYLSVEKHVYRKVDCIAISE